MWLRPFIARSHRALKPGGAVSLIEGPFKGFKACILSDLKIALRFCSPCLGSQQRILVPSHQVIAE